MLKKITKKLLFEELKDLEDIDLYKFNKFIKKHIKEQNKIILNKEKNNSSYYCLNCKKTIDVNFDDVKKIKYKDKLKCSNCNHKFEVIYKHNNIEKVEDYFNYIDFNKRNEIIIRTFFYRRVYLKSKRKFEIELFEISRFNFNHNFSIKKDSYRIIGSYEIYHSKLNKSWSEDRKNNYGYFYKDFYTYEKCVFKNLNFLKKHLKKTIYKYAALELVIKNNIDIYSYLLAYPAYQKLELLIKLKCINLVKDLIKSYSYDQASYQFKIVENLDKNTINFLIKNNLNLKELSYYIDFKINDISILRKMIQIRMTKRHKFNNKQIDYIYKQKSQAIEYMDYLNDCKDLGRKLNDKKVLFPKNLQEEHIKTSNELKQIIDNKINKKIKDYAKELTYLNLKERKYSILVAKSNDELIEESKELNHCVRTYNQKFANRETSIFFVRKTKELNKSFATLELKNNEIVQIRLKNNAANFDNDFKRFIKKWTKKNKIKEYVF